MSIVDRMTEEYSGMDCSTFKDYLIDDCVQTSHVKVILLCESPHREEVEAKRPLVGKSGRAIVKVLREFELIGSEEIDDNASIGELLYKHKAKFNWLGLMNSCQLPMQKKAYPPCFVRNHERFLDHLKAIRQGAELTSEQKKLRSMIVEDLKQRLKCILCRANAKPLVFACGSVARRIGELTELVCQELPKTPHPSRGQWEMGLELYKTMKRIREKVNAVSETPSS